MLNEAELGLKAKAEPGLRAVVTLNMQKAVQRLREDRKRTACV